MEEPKERIPGFDVDAQAVITVLGGVPANCSGTISATSRDRIEVLVGHPLTVGDIVKAEMAEQYSIGEVVSCESRENRFAAGLALTHTIAKAELQHMLRDWSFRPSGFEAGLKAA